jgi:hypothetical protein
MATGKWLGRSRQKKRPLACKWLVLSARQRILGMAGDVPCTREVCQQYPYGVGKTQRFRQEERYLLVDPFWKVFWVEIGGCDLSAPAKIYGPYRSRKAVD